MNGRSRDSCLLPLPPDQSGDHLRIFANPKEKPDCISSPKSFGVPGDQKPVFSRSGKNRRPCMNSIIMMARLLRFSSLLAVASRQNCEEREQCKRLYRREISSLCYCALLALKRGWIKIVRGKCDRSYRTTGSLPTRSTSMPRRSLRRVFNSLRPISSCRRVWGGRGAAD